MITEHLNGEDCYKASFKFVDINSGYAYFKRFSETKGLVNRYHAKFESASVANYYRDLYLGKGDNS